MTTDGGDRIDVGDLLTIDVASELRKCVLRAMHRR